MLYPDEDAFLGNSQESFFLSDQRDELGFSIPNQEDIATKFPELENFEFGLTPPPQTVPESTTKATPPWALDKNTYQALTQRSIALSEFPEVITLAEALDVIRAGIQAQEWSIVERMSQNRVWKALYFRDFIVGVHSKRIFDIMSSAEKWKQYETLMMEILPLWRLIPSVETGGLQRGQDPQTGEYDTHPVRLVHPPPVPRDESTLWKALYEMRASLIKRRLQEYKGEFTPVIVRATRPSGLSLHNNMFIVNIDRRSRQIGSLVKAPGLEEQPESTQPLNAAIRDDQLERSMLVGPYLLVPQLKLGDTWTMGMIQIVKQNDQSGADARQLKTNLMIFDSDRDPFDLSGRFRDEPEIEAHARSGKLRHTIMNDYMVTTYLGPTVSEAQSMTEELSSDEQAVGTRRMPAAQSGDLNMYSFFSIRDLSWTSESRGRVQVFDMGQSVVAATNFFVVEYNPIERDLSVYEYAQLLATEDPLEYRDLVTWRMPLNQIKSDGQFATGLPMEDGMFEFVGINKNKMTIRVLEASPGYLYKKGTRIAKRVQWTTHRLYMDLSEYPNRILFLDNEPEPPFVATMKLGDGDAQEGELLKNPEVLRELSRLGNSLVPSAKKRVIVDYARQPVTHYNQDQPTQSFVLNLTSAKIGKK